MTIYHCMMCDTELNRSRSICDLCTEVIVDLKFNYDMDGLYKRATQRLKFKAIK